METDSKPKTIDLKKFFDGRERFLQSITNAESVLADARKELAAYDSQTKQGVIGLLDAGATTGDPFRDQVIRSFGIDRKALEGFATFNERLIEAKGSELFLAASHEEQIRFASHEEPRPEDFVTCWRYIVGILSGEHVKIWSDPLLTIVLPFDCYVMSGYGWRAETLSERFEGTLTLQELVAGRPSVQAVITHILKSSGGLAANHRNPLDEHAECVHILIGSEISEENVRKLDCGLFLEDLEKMRTKLKTPTPTEQVQGAHI